jgi:hypothetical protein
MKSAKLLTLILFLIYSNVHSEIHFGLSANNLIFTPTTLFDFYYLPQTSLYFGIKQHTFGIEAQYMEMEGPFTTNGQKKSYNYIEGLGIYYLNNAKDFNKFIKGYIGLNGGIWKFHSLNMDGSTISNSFMFGGPKLVLDIGIKGIGINNNLDILIGNGIYLQYTLGLRIGT